MAEPAQAPNRLENETSPYLLQHAHNPVDWYPWGPEAHERARREDRPIFLSIGYAACHWCHVMERESFEDPAIARLMNEGFVCIKVDREERPDLDEIYMTATQLLTGNGGWPMSVFLTPDLQPFFAGTYFPPEDRWGHAGFPSVLSAVLEAYRTRRGEVVTSAGEITDAVRRATTASAEDGASRGRAGLHLIDAAAMEFARRFDASHGGFGGAPKFPPHLGLDLLLRHHRRTGSTDSLGMVTLTLERMARGGIHDQIGGGFHRYAVDDRWLVPHFEKMLYDNALLAPVYLDAAVLTGRDEFTDAARGTLEFVMREMTDAGGGFHSSLDADSEGEEGRYYVWTPQEVEAVLGAEDARLFAAYYDVTPAGNYEGRNILQAPHPAEAIAPRLGLSGDDLLARLAPMRARLLEARTARVRPALDDKVLTAWNGLMISAFARGYEVTGETRYLAAGTRAADFILAQRTPQGRLRRSWGAGRAAGAAFLEDYAFFAKSLLDLFRVTGEPRRLEAARELADLMLELFDDPEGGALFFTPADHEELPARVKNLHDGATPSGNSVAAHVLLELGRLLDDGDLADRARRLFDAHATMIERAPSAFSRLLAALDFALAPPREIVVAGPRGRADTRALRHTAGRAYLPNTIVVEIDPSSEEQRGLRERLPLVAGKTAIGGVATAYVCENAACREPVTDAAALEQMLRGAGEGDRE